MSFLITVVGWEYSAVFDGKIPQGTTDNSNGRTSE
jgi:hypothetical protein